jgi:hypothetical protein
MSLAEELKIAAWFLKTDGQGARAREVAAADSKSQAASEFRSPGTIGSALWLRELEKLCERRMVRT